MERSVFHAVGTLIPSFCNLTESTDWRRKEQEVYGVVNTSDMISNVTDYFLRPTQKKFHYLSATSGAKNAPPPPEISHPSAHFLILRKKINIRKPSSLFTTSCLGYKSVAMEAATMFVSDHGQ